MVRTAQSCITETTRRRRSQYSYSRNSLRTHARPLVHHVSPASAEDIPVLSCHRLGELALPKHGTQLDKWTRIEQRENESLRARKAQAAHDAERTVHPNEQRMELAIPMAEPREQSKTEREVHELTHLYPQQWCDHCVKARGVENPHKRVTLERADSTLPMSRPLEACLEWWQTKEQCVWYWSMWTLDT